MATRRKQPSALSRHFGRFARRLREARGLTQEQLAERARLSSDTIRRLEYGTFSPSLDTLGKLVVGLSLDLATLFESFVLPERGAEREILAVARTLSREDLAVALRVLAFLAELLRGIADSDEAIDAEPGSGESEGGEDA
jgi:transcriptional regulator with XRE-family HTH domain